MNPETTYLQNLESIDRIAAFVARRGHLSPDETEEFVQIVRVCLFENDYAIIRKFEGRSTFSTYLTTVIIRLFHQVRVEQWGKWRPSAEAKRLGNKAIVLERLITRDGFTFDEAVKILTTRAGDAYTVAELEALYVRLPLRNPRVKFVSEGDGVDVPAPRGQADDLVELSERERVARLCGTVLRAQYAQLGAEDRLILELRFSHARKVPDIARIVGIDYKKIYKMLDKVFVVLRRALEDAGVSRADIDNLLSHGDQEIRLNLSEECPPDGPSNPPDGEL